MTLIIDILCASLEAHGYKEQAKQCKEEGRLVEAKETIWSKDNQKKEGDK